MITREYIECVKTELSCKLAKLGAKYTDNLFLGNEDCEDENLKNLIMASNLFDVLCLVKFELNEDDEYVLSCFSEKEVKDLINSLKKYLGNDCGCN